MVTYFSILKKKVVSSFLEMAKLFELTAADIYYALKKTVQKHEPHFSKFTEIGTDNARS